MSNHIEEIKDDEVQIIGRAPKSIAPVQEKDRRNRGVAIVSAILVIAIGILAIIFWPKQEPEDPYSGVFENVEQTEPQVVKAAPQLLGHLADSTKAYTEKLDTVINDIPLTIYIPHNAKPSLAIGTPDIFDKNIVFVTQAADIRADNGKINGAFVLAGKPMAWGLSKKGYVGIIDDKITVGVADNSPLFEEATEKGGYFFRQYPLVDNSVLVENEPKGKAIRKAICDRAGEIIIVMSITPESFHDFAQALVDLQVDNAVYLVGSDSYGYFRDKYDHFTQIYEKRRGGYKYENYILWTID